MSSLRISSSSFLALSCLLKALALAVTATASISSSSKPLASSFILRSWSALAFSLTLAKDFLRSFSFMVCASSSCLICSLLFTFVSLSLLSPRLTSWSHSFLTLAIFSSISLLSWATCSFLSLLILSSSSLISSEYSSSMSFSFSSCFLLSSLIFASTLCSALEVAFLMSLPFFFSIAAISFSWLRSSFSISSAWRLRILSISSARASRSAPPSRSWERDSDDPDLTPDVFFLLLATGAGLPRPPSSLLELSDSSVS
mmetsp:Transcript_4388/g.8277  ORF Transcript_4388/g.8277 Transcript_4388/m.8277 type:complete len:257 (+) Transcript_4388:3757-4527(+)